MHLRLTSSEFYDLTPLQLQHLLKRHRETLWHQELLAGIIASTVANTVPSKRTEPFVPRDFMPGRNVRTAGELTNEKRRQIASSTRSFFDLAVRQTNKSGNLETIQGEALR